MSLIALTVSSCLTSCRTDIPRVGEIPKGEKCLLLTDEGFCQNTLNNTEYELPVSQMRGYECVTLDYRKELEFFIYDILEENAQLRIDCGEKCEGENQ